VSTAEKYVFSAYVVFLVVVLAYLVIHSFRLAQLERELAALTELARGRAAHGDRPKAAAVG
jgi:hypothetical protein